MIGSATPEGAMGDTFVVPCDLVWFKDKPLLGFAEVNGDELLRPLWTHTVRRRRLVALRPLDDIPAEPSNYRIAGMIHHMGRCGSTLLAELLSVLPGVYVVREPPAFGNLLDRNRGTVQDRIRWVRILISVYGNVLGDRLRHLVLKLAPFHTFHAKEMAAAFPGVPAIFIHRNPVEVLVSMCESPPQMNAAFQAEWFPPDLRPAALESGDRRNYPDMTARMTAAICEAACAIKDGRSLDYRSLPAAAWEKVAPFFGIEAGDAERLQMADLSKYYSKNVSGRQEFKDDSEEKRIRADAALRSCASRYVEPRLERLKRTLPPL